MIFDHFAVAATTLAEAVAHVEDSLGVKMGPGGQHAHFATHNRLIGLEDGLYLEAIATDPSVPAPTYPRWFDLDSFTGAPRITNWICRVDDLDATLVALPNGAGTPVSLARGDLRWKMAVPSSGKLPCDGAFPALIQWQTDKLPGLTLPSSGLRLVRYEIAHPEADRLRQTLPIEDERLLFVPGDFAMRATFDTPSGQRVLL